MLALFYDNLVCRLYEHLERRLTLDPYAPIFGRARLRRTGFPFRLLVQTYCRRRYL